MASGKEKLDAFKFARRRMVANLLVPTPTGSDEGAPRPVKTFVASILIGVVAVAGMTVLGYLKPSAPSGWQNGLAVDGTTGAAYVDNGGELHPILNITSAQLLLGTTFTKYDVPDSVINAQKMGAPLGILGAPPVAPAASQVDLKSWTYCQQAENPDNQGIAGGQTVLEIGYGQGSTTAVTAGSGFIVHDSKGDNYLLAGNYSYRIAPIRGLEGTVSGDGNDDIAPAGTWVSDSFLNVVEAGAPIVEIVPEGPVFGLGPAHAHRHREAAAAEEVQTGQCVRQFERIVHRDHQHTCSQPDALGHRGRPRERDQGIEEEGGGIVLGGRVDDMVTDPEVDEAQFLGVSRRPRDGVRTGDPPVLR